MTYAVALPNSEGARSGALTPGDFVPDESAFLVKRDNTHVYFFSISDFNIAVHYKKGPEGFDGLEDRTRS
jgi:hypothetical protein